MNILSQVYDELLGDKEGTVLYANFINKHRVAGALLECACGSGDLLALLSQKDNNTIGIDLDEQMIQLAKEKYSLAVQQQDMLKLDGLSNFSTVVCVGDSINYLSSISDVKIFFSEVFCHLEKDGVFIFDIHNLDRLEEFKEEYIEEGLFSLGEYQWRILSSNQQLLHQFIFYIDERVHVENIVQQVFDPQEIIDLLNSFSVSFEIYTDFDLEGIQQGEKLFFIVRRK